MLIGLTQDKAAPLMMIRIWGHCQLRKTHVFNDLTPNALKAICRWEGDPDRLMGILLECGFIKKNGTQVVVHQWDEVNNYLIHCWVNGAKGGRPKKPNDNPGLTQQEPIDKIREDKRREEYIEDPKIPNLSYPKKNQFKQPTLVEVKHEFMMLELPESEAVAFFDNYEAKGWMMGSTPMNNLGAACRTWKSNSQKFKGKFDKTPPILRKLSNL